MVALEQSENIYFVDDHGAETISAARALLQTRLHADADDDDALLQYVSALVPSSHVFSAFLRDLAAVGAETAELAHTAREAWPTLFTHVLDEVEANIAIYDHSDSFNGYALSYLLPNHPETTQSMYDEFSRDTFPWVYPDEIAELIPRWLPYAAGRPSCALELVRFLRQLPTNTQLHEGLKWLAVLCLSRADRQLVSYAPMDEWLVEIKPAAEAAGRMGDWLRLVGRLVYAGNKTLAEYSR